MPAVDAFQREQPGLNIVSRRRMCYVCSSAFVLEVTAIMWIGAAKMSPTSKRKKKLHTAQNKEVSNTANEKMNKMAFISSRSSSEPCEVTIKATRVSRREKRKRKEMKNDKKRKMERESGQD